MTELSIRELHFSYGKKDVLKGIDFEPKGGQITALMGVNGAGKSTLFKCLAAVHAPKGGEILLGGVPLAKVPVKSRLKSICYIPQNSFVGARLTVFETILLAQENGAMSFATRAEAMQNVENILDITGLTELSGMYLNELSGGQQQRIGTAQALVQRPDVLLMDEPTSALDLHYQLKTLEIIQEFTRSQDIITIIALHDINLATRYADWMVLLHNGSMQSQGTPAEMVASGRLEESYRVNLEQACTPRGVPLVAAHLQDETETSA